VAESVLAQVHSLHQAFADRRDAVRLERRHCACAACAAIDGLGIKSFLHAGPIAIKQIRQFREIAGAPVIVLHRLLKNSIAEREYLLLTNSFAALLPEAIAAARAHLAVADGFGEVHCTLLTSAPP
jgi:hypothetical protein